MALADAVVHEQVSGQERGRHQSGAIAEPGVAAAGACRRRPPGHRCGPRARRPRPRVARLGAEGGRAADRRGVASARDGRAGGGRTRARRPGVRRRSHPPCSSTADSTCRGDSVPKCRSGPRREVAARQGVAIARIAGEAAGARRPGAPSLPRTGLGRRDGGTRAAISASSGEDSRASGRCGYVLGRRQQSRRGGAWSALQKGVKTP